MVKPDIEAVVQPVVRPLVGIVPVHAAVGEIEHAVLPGVSARDAEVAFHAVAVRVDGLSLRVDRSAAHAAVVRAGRAQERDQTRRFAAAHHAGGVAAGENRRPAIRGRGSLGGLPRALSGAGRRILGPRGGPPGCTHQKNGSNDSELQNASLAAGPTCRENKSHPRPESLSSGSGRHAVLASLYHSD